MTTMAPVTDTFFSGTYHNLATYVPGIIGALVVLILGWIVGRLLGKAARIILDKIGEQHVVEEGADLASIRGSMKSAGLTLGYIGDITVRIVVYLIALLAAVNILNLDYLSQLMMEIVNYIPHVVVFVIILVAGFLLIDAFIDFLNRYYAQKDVEFIRPVLVLLRVFLYFITVILALSQLELDLTIIYTFVTPVAWGIGLGLGAAIAIIVGFGLKDRSGEIMDQVLSGILKK
jgi:hypothetical protein